MNKEGNLLQFCIMCILHCFEKNHQKTEKIHVEYPDRKILSQSTSASF